MAHKKSLRRVRGLFLFFAVLCLHSANALAAPYRPTNDDLILVEIPEAASQARALQSHTLPPAQAATLAQLFIQRARASGDPRYLGYAQGVLAPWWDLPEPPDRVLLIRATLRQSQHEFSNALDDLDLLLKHHPNHAQAWLTRATVLRVLGRYSEASLACAKLEGISDGFVPTLCKSVIEGLTGNLIQAIEKMDLLHLQQAGLSDGLSAWYFAKRCDMAVRSGSGAAECFAAALKQHDDDLGLRTNYADWLLDQQRPEVVLDLIPADSAVENLLLRRTLALQSLQRPEFSNLSTRIREYFDNAHKRGEEVHLREEARYRLAIGDIDVALKLAQQNWLVQREPWDVRILLAAARAANQPYAAQVVRDWLKQTNLQDVRLARLNP